MAIPFVFDFYNNAHLFPDPERSKYENTQFIPEDRRADKCTACGACVTKCTQGIDIPQEMKLVTVFYSG